MNSVTAATRTLVKKLLKLGPYHLVRGAPNRFDAIEECLRHLARNSFAPRLVIDAGANLGAFARMARTVFPSADIHMVEPQPSCVASLRTLAAEPGFFLHPVAVTSSAGPVSMVLSYDGDTGAHIPWEKNRDAAGLLVQGATLDDLFDTRCRPDDRTLLKLDLQGHEMIALQGAARLLPKVEIVLLEVSFFRQIGEPTIPEIVRFFDESGFELFDIAALSARRRDGRLRQGDLLFVRRDSPLVRDREWH